MPTEAALHFQTTQSNFWLPIWLTNMTLEPTGNKRHALTASMSTGRDELIARADPDLKTWLPPDLWRHLGATGVAQMVDFARVTLQEVHDHIDGASQGASDGSNPAEDRP